MAKVLFTANSDTTTAKRLMPTPFVTIAKSYEKAGDGEMLGCTYTITLTGTIVAHMGSPKSDGGWITTDAEESLTTAEKYESVIAKMKAISNLFSSDNDGGLLEVDFDDGADGLSAHVQIESVDFSEGNNLVQKTGYTINLTTSILYGPHGTLSPDAEEFPFNISSADESWDIQETDDTTMALNVLVGVSDTKKVYQLTHTMSATGKPKSSTSTTGGVLASTNPIYETPGDDTTPVVGYDAGGEAWQQALAYIATKIGTGATPGSVSSGYQLPKDMDNPIPDALYVGIYGMNLLVASYGSYNYVRTQQIDKKGGSVSVTETWTLAANAAVETLDISISSSEESNDSEGGNNTITISGTIRGLAAAPTAATQGSLLPAATDVNETKYANAKTVFADRLLYMDDLARITANTYLCSGCGYYFRSLPDSKQVGVNVLKGEINYSFTYSDKNKEFGDGIQDASVSISDTHPGNVLSLTQVLGRPYGPVIQDVGSTTEYKRSFSISLTMNAKKIGLTRQVIGTCSDPTIVNKAACLAVAGNTWTGPPTGTLSLEQKMKDCKPSMFGLAMHNLLGVDLYNGLTIRDQVNSVIAAAVPDETGILKYRVSGAPSETWDIQSGKYDYRIEWVYEKIGTVYPALSTGFVGGNL